MSRLWFSKLQILICLYFTTAYKTAVSDITARTCQTFCLSGFYYFDIRCLGIISKHLSIVKKIESFVVEIMALAWDEQSWLFWVYFELMREMLLNKNPCAWLSSLWAGSFWGPGRSSPHSCHGSNMNPLRPSYSDSWNMNAFSWKLTEQSIVLMWKDYTHRALWLSDVIERSRDVAATSQQKRSILCFLWFHNRTARSCLMQRRRRKKKARLNGLMCAVACDGLEEHRAVSVKTYYNMSSLIKFKKQRSVENDLWVFFQHAIFQLTRFLGIETPAVAVVKLCGGNS